VRKGKRREKSLVPPLEGNGGRKESLGRRKHGRDLL